MRRAIPSLLALALACGGPTQSEPNAPYSPFLLGGIAVNEPYLDRFFSRMKRAGLNTVSTTIYARQGRWDAANLAFSEETEPLRQEIARAKQAGLRVVLILRVDLDHGLDPNRFLWHGMISPRDEETLERWFEAYSAFVLRWALVAEEEGVDVLGLGSELSRLTSTKPVDRLPDLEAWYLDTERQSDLRRKLARFDAKLTSAHRERLQGGHFADNDSFHRARSRRWRAWAEVASFQDAPDPIAAINRRRNALLLRWRHLIAKVRPVFSGKLTYAANFDQVSDVGFWRDLDLIGVNAYFELRDHLGRERLEGRLRAAWRDVFRALDTFREEEGLTAPFLFTEIGYTEKRHSTLKPWAPHGFTLVNDELLIFEDEPPSAMERAAALRALFAVSRYDYPGRLFGLLYWKLSTWPDQRSVEPFVVVLGQNDPAERALTRFLEAPPR